TDDAPQTLRGGPLGTTTGACQAPARARRFSPPPSAPCGFGGGGLFRSDRGQARTVPRWPMAATRSPPGSKATARTPSPMLPSTRGATSGIFHTRTSAPLPNASHLPSLLKVIPVMGPQPPCHDFVRLFVLRSHSSTVPELLPSARTVPSGPNAADSIASTGPARRTISLPDSASQMRTSPCP